MLKIENIVKQYAEHRALDHVSLEVKRGTKKVIKRKLFFFTRLRYSRFIMRKVLRIMLNTFYLLNENVINRWNYLFELLYFDQGN